MISNRTKYMDEVARAVSSRTRHFLKLNAFGTYRSASTIAWMVENGKGLLAFEEYPPGTFQAVVRDGNEVWFRRVD